MASVAFIDFETRSTVDIQRAGSDVYARHPHTDILCLAYAFDDGEVRLWKNGDSPPTDLLDHVRLGGKVVGHNVAGFEVPIWNFVAVPKFSWPQISIAQVYCPMASAYAMALPGSLEKAAAAVGIDAQKDLKGHRVMLVLSRPKGFLDSGEPEWHELESAPEKFAALYKYCEQDVEVERQLYKRLAPLSPKEREVWMLDFKINQRGVQVDIPAAKAALKIADLEKARYNERIRKITKQFVTTYNSSSRFRDWLISRGVDVPGVAKADVVEVLSDPNLPSDCREALILRQEAAKSSTAKLEAMIVSTCPDGRMRGILQYHGAGTGRWAGRRAQLHNLPSPKIPQSAIDSVFKVLEQGI